MYACPLCKKKLVEEKFKGSYLSCKQKQCKFFKYKFPINNHIPNLIPFGENFCIFKKEKKTKNYSNYGSKLRILDIYKRRSRSILSNIFKGENSNSIYNFEFLEKSLNPQSKVLIIGGGNIGNGMNSFLKKCYKYAIEYHSIDVYFSPNITAVADAHYLPFLDNYFNIVIIQAVLEHVVCPEKVVAEIYRVSANNCLIYSETPFLQAIHEGPYDFTRFTHSGHRWLFRNFEEISSGAHQGSFSSILFTSSYAFSALFRNRLIGIAIRLLFTRIARLLDFFIKDEWNIDVACGCFFLGKKSIKFKTKKDSNWLVDYYKGSQK